jgi:hypothetical protein
LDICQEKQFDFRSFPVLDAKEKFVGRKSAVFSLSNFIIHDILYSMAIISGGTAHQLTLDIRSALQKNARAATAWERLTPLARNEWICWVTFVKKEETRKDHVKRLVRELQEGKRRPCCWLGCTHRTDKEISPSIKGILARRATQK